ncbi:hypothetical protein BJ508DRAFT_305182 [Ascobolus immersus RN42]|uniref:GDP/GTP exchange factor Sec2 N-terminal domain-containing protein n=1 Tax=Ascobolus immersus RN42 TaxID=1160509 RepID=A0A3N4I9X7_ASCIM|nr:hypothetical protein BJ508DRAFT_305182 [Ascobolus immersus RN42]
MEPHHCPNCGIPVPLTASEEDSRRRILELEAQVKILTERAFESADKLTTYEHEVHTLKRAAAHSRTSSQTPSHQHTRTPSHPLALALPPTPAQSTTGRPSTPSGPSHSHRPSTPTSRITSFLSMRPRAPPSPPPDVSLLEKERSARLAAEEKLQQVTAELEDLSASLFQSANEMVAEERRMRARVEEKCKMLEEREKGVEAEVWGEEG